MNRAEAVHTRAWTRLIASRSRRRRAAAAALTAGILLTGALDGPGTALASVKPAAKALKVTTTSLPAGTGGKVYSAKLTATGGIKPYTWSISQGSLPTGLTLVPATGLINGVPTSAGTSDFTVAVTDSQNPAVMATAAESISVNIPSLVITTTSLPQATAGAAYSAKLAATGGIKPYTWSLTGGPLPAGLKLAPATGVISGTPTTAGDFTIGVAVTDGESPPASTPGTVSLSIGVAPLVVTTGSTLPTATSGAPYSVRLAAAGGIKPYTWSVAGGSLPAGLKLGAAGVISGTPKTDGTTTFTVQVADAENPAVTATATESITVADQLTVTTTSLPGGTADQPYSAALAAAGGVTPYTWSVSSGSLPAGLSLDPATGAISGTPTGTGMATFTAAVTDAGNPPVTAGASLTITVTALPLAVTTSSLQTATQGRIYDDRLTATGGVTPYTWSVSSGSLPAGLSLDPGTGDISGTPTGLGASTFTVQVTDSDSPAASASASFTLTVAAPLAVTTTSLPTAVVGQPYMQTLTAVGGIAPYTWSIVAGSLPGGLALDPATGIISGTATGTGRVLLTVQVTDSGSPPASAQMSLPLNAAMPLQMTTSSLPNAIQGKGYDQKLAASGGVNPYKWSISAGSLPAGLSMSQLSGEISGAPTTPGMSSFTVQLTDSSTPALQVSTALTITVATPLTVPTPSLPNGEVGQPYTAQLSETGGIGPYTWSVVAGSIPGLTLDPSTGQITGTPQVPGGNSFLAQVADAENPPQTAMVNVNISVAPALIIGTQLIPSGEVGGAYQGEVTGQLGVAPYTYSIVAGGLPAGLIQDPHTGLIFGTPEQSGEFPFTVQVTDSNNPAATVTAHELMTIQPQVQVLTMALPLAEQNVGYSFPLAATGGYAPYTWTANAMPPGLVLLPDGTITGVPLASGGFTFVVTVTDSNSPPVQATAFLVLQIIPMPPDVAQRPGQTAMHAAWGRLRG
jgi:Putative Ig domain